jgi:hypothetical protein
MKNAFILMAGQDKLKLAWAKEVAIPLIPILLGVLSGVLVPLRPDYLVAYLKTQEISSPMMVYAAYGASIGTFADYIHQRIAGMLKIKEAHGVGVARQ